MYCKTNWYDTWKDAEGLQLIESTKHNCIRMISATARHAHRLRKWTWLIACLYVLEMMWKGCNYLKAQLYRNHIVESSAFCPWIDRHRHRERFIQHKYKNGQIMWCDEINSWNKNEWQMQPWSSFGQCIYVWILLHGYVHKLIPIYISKYINSYIYKHTYMPHIKALGGTKSNIFFEVLPYSYKFTTNKNILPDLFNFTTKRYICKCRQWLNRLQDH